jgi:protease secretion system membrane fusion protein
MSNPNINPSIPALRQDAGPESPTLNAQVADAGMPGKPVARKAPSNDPAVDLDDARPRRWGWLLLIVGFGGFVAWSSLAPLDQGVSATGTVVVTGSRKAVQPLTGGKVAAITVKEGDAVKVGQVLVKLDSTQSQSQLEVTRGQLYSLLATQARLNAERAGAKNLDFSSMSLAARTDPRGASAMSLQQQTFATRRASYESEVAVMQEGIKGLELQVVSIEAARESKQAQLKLMREELKNAQELAAEGFHPKNRVYEQERAVAALAGGIAEDNVNISRVRQSMIELRARLVSREQELRKEVQLQLADVQRETSAHASRIEALEFELSNTQVRSPADGIVVGLATHTVGGVVGTGTVLMEVVPDKELLRIEAQVPPHLIDKVKTGLEVHILFPAFNQAITPNVPGTLVQVSADVLVDPKQGFQYFKAIVQVTPEGMKLLGQHQIRAGMPAEVFIRTGERTFMNYLFKPLRDRIRSSLTEI